MDLLETRWIRTLLDEAAQGVLIENGERIVYINRCYAELLGQPSPEGLMQQHVGAIISDADVARLLEFGRRRTSGHPAPVNYQFSARRRDGYGIWLNAAVSTSLISSRAFIMSIVRPVSGSTDPHEIAGLHQKLSEREMQVFRSFVEGKRLKEISLELQVSVKTVTTHRARMMRKLGVNDIRGLFQYALRLGFIDWS
ncbi:MAG TPA: LuxR C-terminal-related transcriptional regulator [Thermoanaerobaculia bacterium]|nr:LuxR C-terminal-related transcriptional regulator [Thermoanaerobaculia bacterium]